MRSIFLWFYCLPILDAVILILLTTAAFVFLRDRYGKLIWWKVGIPLLLLIWITIILYGTLGQRIEGANSSDPVLIPFHSYFTALTSGPKELYRTNFMNAVLFYPAGLLGCELLPKGWNRVWKAALLTCVFTLVSISIEYTQYRFGLGLAEVDDVIHNTLGALLGTSICGITVSVKSNSE